ncbi:MFS transporter [Verminephrobacter eiseniae]|uniref:MFS transporter n=1 Tax=Verminephrobacter eiseniae TaxID=364317 RepID=UPI0022380444|nr:MFS transporter [Verminephrobacter eiseniae]MCW5263576.1 MFS transporter [Verminephrobacter eiseniae]
MTTTPSPGRLPWSIYLLTLAQAFNLTAAVISVTIAALVGTKLAATAALGTIPYGIQFAAVMLFTYPASMLMRRHGRRIVFSLGAVFLISAGLVGYIAVTQESFLLLIVAHGLLGIYIACANFYRFAAVDDLPPEAKARAISWVVAGGVLAAIIGPAIASSLRNVVGHTDFSLCYAAFSALGMLTLLLMALWTPPKTARMHEAGANPVPAVPSGQWNIAIVAAIVSSAGGYFVMNLLMVQASLVMKNICSFDASSRAIQVHVLAMFVPSFFTGSLIGAIGLRQVLITGFMLLLGAAGFGMMDISYHAVFIGLILVGLGWNLVYVGGGALLTQKVSDQERHRWQGINDTLIAGCATLGAFLPAPLLAGFGWMGTNMMMVPLCFAGMFLCWKTFAGAHRRA